ncbi:hypothetical protein L1O03_03845 [Corynebacterium uropygiale]|uniref:Uncharacterized protein n=1 Tax=Corynebacterium uropygiale TaxID=1775911 RepID=A0A9X1QMZ0_9CORY|nr:hypothetical protein [Corynebacterium uropygiale]MCF4006312.1 hypothetical protein [Corynebacterium uropygiale]
MSLEKYPTNPIERRKAAVRRYSKSGAIRVGAGLGGGIVLGLVFSSWLIFWLGFAVAVVGGVRNWQKISRIINHKD